ncbi:CYTH domain-containing protein [Mesonia ostreae]|uniref:CYTH domain-containing protein n=1 Tax=Mesonia ostreae TaxID=861110 RepID=A0ABU2KIC7_9FLAO|nr:CYTH domain-containing protein [Mesonia ostreae]MDT0294468.1 CYTH domain-containing protein [Mesonia ostreae]
MQEIERKFLLKNDSFKKEAYNSYSIKQAYLNSHKERTTRIRIRGEEAFITVKGKSSKSGLSRFEWEKNISIAEAEELLQLCEPGRIEKTRFLVKVDHHIFEVDEFYKENEGLIIAEVELSSENEKVKLPNWIAEEVTGDKKYYNSYLIQNPYKNWKK